MDSLEERISRLDCLNDIPDLFDEYFVQTKYVMATKEEIKELLTFIGGFEKWPLLNEDCQREVVKYLDYKSRYNLGRCSKSDYDIVEKTPIHVKSVEILHNDFFNEYYDAYALSNYSNKMVDNVTVRINFQTGFKDIELIFSQRGEDTLIEWSSSEIIRKSCNYCEEAVKFAEKWMKKSNFELKGIEVKMAEYPFATSQIKSLPYCKNVSIHADDVDSFNWWLKKCPEQLDVLKLNLYSGDRKSFTLPSEFLNAPRIMQASEIDFWCLAPFSDEQLLKLKAKSIRFDSVEVTDEGINKFIKNWVHGKGVEGFEDVELRETRNRDLDVIIALAEGLDNVRLRATRNRNLDVMLAGLEYVEWDQTFEHKHQSFVSDYKHVFGRGPFYQIKSKIDGFESLTLSALEDSVTIHATGKRGEYNGEAYTFYRRILKF